MMTFASLLTRVVISVLLRRNSDGLSGSRTSPKLLWTDVLESADHRNHRAVAARRPWGRRSGPGSVAPSLRRMRLFGSTATDDVCPMGFAVQPQLEKEECQSPPQRRTARLRCGSNPETTR